MGRRANLLGRLLVLFSPLSVALVVPSTVAADAHVAHAGGLASKKGDAPELPELLGTLVQTHTDERVALDAASPSPLRFDALLRDRATGSSLPFDARLLELVRALAKKYPAARIELVSGFRSPKLNEMLRKKGHHVASHSQHSLAHALDFRIIEDDDGASATRRGQQMDGAVDPRVLERDIRGLGWEGGVGVYLSEGDRFVHADVGPNRRWYGQ